MDDYILIYDYSPLIRLSDEKYPVFFPEVRAENPNTSFPIPIRDYILLPFGYKPVIPTEPSEGDVITEAKPELREDGNYYQSWNVRGYTEEERLAALKFAQNNILSDAIYVYNRDKTEGSTIGFNGENYLVSLSDQEIAFLLSIKFLLNSPSGVQIEEPFTYKFLDNAIVSLTKDEFLSLLNEIFKINYNLAKRYWAFINTVNTTEIQSELPTVPVTFKED